MKDSDFYLASARLLHSQAESDAEAQIIIEEIEGTYGPVIDLGCGHGRHLFGLRSSGRLAIGVDIHPPSAQQAMQYAPVMLADMACLPFPGGTFAAAIAWCNAFGSLPETEFRPFFNEVHRILQHGGIFIVQGTDADSAGELPTDPAFLEFPDGTTISEIRKWDEKASRDHLERVVAKQGKSLSGELSVRYFNRRELTELLASHGFDLKNMRSDKYGFIASFRKMF